MSSSNRKSDSLEWKTARDVLACIEKTEDCSRAGIAKTLGLSRTTVSTIVGKFIRAGLVEERRGGANGRGRPGSPLSLTQDVWFALGAEFHSRQWVFAVTDLSGRIVRTRRVALEETTPEEFLDKLIVGLRYMMKSAPKRLLSAVGIGAPGLVDCETGTIIRADDLGWRNVPVRARIEAKLGIEASLLNRNRASGLAEARFGAGRGVHDFVYIGIGTGISAAIVADGVLVHGANYGAGEIGHVILDPEGPLCGCGKHGCLQALASGSAMVRTARGVIEGRPDDVPGIPEAKARALRRTTSLGRILAEGNALSGEAICAEACKGDPLAVFCVEEAARHLGIAVANLVTTFNPDKIVLGGPVGNLGEPLLGSVRREAGRWAMEHSFSALGIEAGILGEYTGALGAACLVLDRKLELLSISD